MKDNAEALQWNADVRGMDAKLHDVVRYYEEFRGLEAQISELRGERNALKRNKSISIDEKRERGIALKEELHVLEERRREVVEGLEREGEAVPNTMHPATPETQPRLICTAGKVEDDRVHALVDPRMEKEVRESQEEREFADETREHENLVDKFQLVNWGSGVRSTGSKFATFCGAGTHLALALERWALDEVSRKFGFEPWLVPDVVRTSNVRACGFRPRGEESNVYDLDGTTQSLSATAEIAVAGSFAGQTLSNTARKVAALSHCFRREAGAAGRASRGLYRLHQFSKVELFLFTPPTSSPSPLSLSPTLGAYTDLDSYYKVAARESSAVARIVARADAAREEGNVPPEREDSEEWEWVRRDADLWLEHLVGVQIHLLEQLGLFGRVLEMPANELGAPARRKIDIEVWMPGRGEFGEVSSASDCFDFQSRRLGIKMRKNDQDRSTMFPRTLNATAIAVPRILLALLETHATPDASDVLIPSSLQPYLQGATKLSELMSHE